MVLQNDERKRRGLHNQNASRSGSRFHEKGIKKISIKLHRCKSQTASRELVNNNMDWTYSDGGREAAGFKGEARDCVVRAIAIATRIPYREVYDAINNEAKRENIRKGGKSTARTGVHRVTYERYLIKLGWHWKRTMDIGTGCKVHMRASELPPGRIIVSLSRHLACVVDGVVFDNHDCTRNGTRCVYGYYSHDS